MSSDRERATWGTDGPDRDRDAPAFHAPLVVRARPLGLLVVGLLIGLLAVAAPFAFAALGYGVDPANAAMLWLIAGAVVLLLLGYALYERSKTFSVGYGRLEASSWFGSRGASLQELAGVSLRRWPTGESITQLPSLVFWDRQERPIADVGVFFFSRRSLRRLVDRLRAECPDLEVDRAVRHYLEQD